VGYAVVAALGPWRGAVSVVSVLALPQRHPGGVRGGAGEVRRSVLTGRAGRFGRMISVGSGSRCRRPPASARDASGNAGRCERGDHPAAWARPRACAVPRTTLRAQRLGEPGSRPHPGAGRARGRFGTRLPGARRPLRALGRGVAAAAPRAHVADGDRRGLSPLCGTVASCRRGFAGPMPRRISP
jgi:hypothetical protein